MEKNSFRGILISILVFAFLMFAWVVSAVAAPGDITTVAGIEKRGFSSDGGRATEAILDFPHSVFVDSLGNLFIADSYNHRIRRVDAKTGIITTVAGGGTGGLGDGGKATQAMLDRPFGVFVDSLGNLFIADSGNNRIRRVDGKTGIITTVAGIMERGFSGDGGRATEAMLDFPHGVFVDSLGDLFIADSGNNRIRRVDAKTGIITTVAGGGTGGLGDGGKATQAMLDRAFGVFVDSLGNLLIADVFSIRRVDGQTGIITTVAGIMERGFSGDGGKATEARIYFPEDVFVDSAGNLFIADTYNHRIRRVDGQTAIITTVAGTGPIGGDQGGFSGDGGKATEARLSDPYDVFVDSAGNLFIVTGLRIRRVEGIAAPTTLGGIFTIPGVISDFTPPKVVTSSPKDGESGIDPAKVTKITLQFDRPITVAAVKLVAVGGDALQIRAEAKEKVVEVTFLGGAMLAGETKYELAGKTKDVTGNEGSFKITFETMKGVVPTPWDVNGDAEVNIFDLVVVASSIGQEVKQGDVNGDGKVDIFDLVIVASHFGEKSTAAPSPHLTQPPIKEVDYSQYLPLLEEAYLLLLSASDSSPEFEMARKLLEHLIALAKLVVKETKLFPNYPSPFNPETWIPYQLSESAEVRLDIYDVNGRLVRGLQLGRKSAGLYIDKSKAIYWDGRNNSGERVGSGIYFYRLQAGAYTAVKKMVVLK